MKSVKVFLLMALMLTYSITQAQHLFFPTKAGIVQYYVQKNAKGNPESYWRYTIKDVTGSGDNMSISYVMEYLDKNRKPANNPPVEIPLTVVIKDGKMVMDMKGMFASILKDSQLNVEITGEPSELPGNIVPGQGLKDTEMTMTMNAGPIKIATNIKITDATCIAIEDVKVQAGTFKCHKIAQTVATTVMRRTVVSKTLSWYAPGVGIVKSENYNDKDQLENSTELVEMN